VWQAAIDLICQLQRSCKIKLKS